MITSTLARRTPFLLVFLLAVGFKGMAQKTWVGPGNWSNGALWTPAGVPVPTDRVFFNAGSGNCNLDVNATVAHFEMTAAYLGIFSQGTSSLTVYPNGIASASGMVIAGGTFTGGNNNITLPRQALAPNTPTHFTQSGGVFTSTRDTLMIQGNFTRSGGTFTHNNGSVIIRGVGGTPYNNIVGNTTFSKIEFNSISDFDKFDINATTDLIVEDTMVKSGAMNNLNLGDVNIWGDLIITNVIVFPAAQNPPYGSAKLYFNGTGDQHIYGKAATWTNNFIENVYIDKASGTLFLHNYITVGPDWYYTRGTINPGTSTVFFRGVGTIGGNNHALYNVRFWNIDWLNPRRDIQIGMTLTVNHTLEFEGNNWADVYGGTIEAKGDILVTNALPAALYGYCGGNATILINGTGDQLFHGQTSRKMGYLPNIVIDKSGGTLFLKDTISVERSWTYVKGNVDAVTHKSYVNFVPNYNFFNSADIAQYIDGEGTNGTTMLFNNVGIDNPNNLILPPSNQILRILNGDLRVDSVLNVRNHILQMNSNDIFIENSLVTSVQRTTGWIISETTPATSISRLHWFVNNAPNGTSYTFPFGTAITGSTYIPVTLTIGTPGTPSGTGSVSIATYPTVTSNTPNNRPLPPGVTQLNSFIGPENFQRELDRFWVYECYNYSTTPTVSLTFTYRDSEWNTSANSTNIIDETLLRPHQWNPGTGAWGAAVPGSTINTGVNIAIAPNITTCSAFTLVDPTVPDLVFSATDTVLCTGGQVTYSDVFTPPGPTSRTWTFPGGSPGTSTAVAPVVTYNTVGVYDATLCATYPGGTLCNTLTNYITVNPGMTASIDSSKDVQCNGDADGVIIVVASGGSGNFNFAWSDTTLTDSVRTGLSGGIYTVTVSDALGGGCQVILTDTIVEPDSLIVTISNVTNTLCSSSCNGSAQANVTGGTLNYIYDWSNNESTAVADSLCPGNQTVLVTDAHGCTASAPVTIVGSPPLTATFTSVTNASCNDTCDGSITVNPTGGSVPYTYAWSCTNTQTTATITGLCAGSCTVTVTDGNNCEVEIDTVITEPDPIVVTLDKTDITCFGADDGTATVANVTGGTGPMDYEWSPNGEITATVTGLEPGIVTVTVTDDEGCSVTANTVITEPTAVTITSTGKTDALCNGDSTGTAWVVVSGGTSGAGYDYIWSPGTHVDNDTITDLWATTYTVIVNDDNDCADTATITVNQPAALSLTLDKEDVNCLGGNDGRAWVASLTGAVGTPASDWYDWSPPGTPVGIGDTVEGLSAGGVSVTVTDDNGCTVTASTTIDEPATGITLTMQKTDISCFGLCDGTAGVTPLGGSGSYTYEWSCTMQTTATITGLCAGTCIVTVTDANLCTRIDSVEIQEPAELVTTLAGYDISCFGANDGSAKATISGGTPPYFQVGWNPPAGVSFGMDSVYDLPPGQICYIDSDANGCLDTVCATINEPAEIVLTMDSIAVLCNGDTNGVACVTAVGGVGGFTYNWSRGTDSLNCAIRLAPGAISVTVTDSSGCSMADTTTIDEPPAMVVTLFKKDLTCFGSNDGMAWVTVSGGTAPYTFNWIVGTPVATGDTSTGLSAGEVIVTVTDSIGCSVSDTITIGEPSAIVITEAIIPVTCPDGSDGGVNITVTGGVPAYDFLWSNGSVGQNLSAVAAGFYTVIVTDDSLCTETKSFTVQEGTRFEVSANVINASCGSADGSIDVTVVGGSGTFTYAWADGPVTEDRTGLTGGTYTITVTDGISNCEQSLTVTLEDTGGPTVTGTVTDATTCSSNDGSISVVASGTPGPYSYAWSHDNLLVAPIATGLGLGEYTVTVTDDSIGCISVSTFTIGAINGITFTAVVTPAGCGASDGAIDLTILSGTAPYTVIWSHGAAVEDVANLSEGTYSVTVTDNGNCFGDTLFTVSETGGPTVTSQVTEISCFGDENGAIALTVAGNVTYSWSNGATTSSISSLKPGTYSVTVADTASRCSSIRAFTLTEPDAIMVIADRSNISCNGAADGSINLTVSGGDGSYTYSWTGPITSALQNISSLGAGTYDVAISDGNLCSSTLSVELTEPAPIILDLDSQSVECGGDTNGKAWVTVIGGVAPFDYDWSYGDTIGIGDTVENLYTGYVSLTVTDVNGCTATDSILIPEPTPLSLTITKTDITCFGANDGMAVAVPGGGTPAAAGYTYLWDDQLATTNDTVTGLLPGFVVVIVTDSNNCSITDSIEIAEPDSLTTTVTGTDVTCFGDSNGTATVVVTGGRAPYTYVWSSDPGDTNASVSGLLQGTVYVTVTDSSGCTKVDSVVIGAPAAPLTVDSIVVTNVTCFGGSDGTITVFVSGGTPGYDYNFGTVGVQGATENVWTQLPAGTYVITITDTNGCELLDTAIVAEPAEITIVTSKVDISCFGANDGIIRIDSVYGGTPGTLVPYTYSWSGPGGTADSLTGLGPGTYTVTVTDSVGCEQTADVTIVEPAEIVLSITKVDISCYGLEDGEADVTASGGNGGFIYDWSDGDVVPGDSSRVTGLPAGIVTVTVTDSRGCSDSISIDIIEPDSITLTITSTNVSCFGGNDGTASVSVSGGTPGYSYDWNDGDPVGDSSSVVNVSAGIITVTVTDSRGCEKTISDTITEPAAPLTISLTKTDVSCFNGSDGTATVSISGGTPSYAPVWSRGDNPTDTTVTGLTAGIVTVIVTDDNGCQETDSITIDQPAELLLTIAVDSNASCTGPADGGVTVSLTGGTSPYDYDWSNGSGDDVLDSPLTSNSINGLPVGLISVTITDANDCAATIDATIIERAGPQIAANGVVLDRPTCDRQDGGICITATTTDMPLTYSWAPVLNGNCPTGLGEGTYSVTVTDDAGCDTSFTVDLIEIPGPSATIVKIKDSYCDDNDGQLTAIVTSGVLPYVFVWAEYPDTSTIISRDSIVTGLVPGQYIGVISDSNGCSVQVDTNIVNIASPNAAIAPVSPQTIFEGQVIDLFATADIPTSVFNWSPMEGLVCDNNCDTLTASPRITTTYELIVIDSSTQCADTAYMTVIVKDEKTIFVPNVITPNGDGVNDVWRITELQEIFLDNELVIVNRWGDEIFRSKSYQNDFDGTYKNNKLPDGTYYYIIKLNDIEETITGPLTIISE